MPEFGTPFSGLAKDRKITKEEFFSLKCDILIPAALELQICGDEAQNIQAQLVVEAANGPIDLEADRILAEKGIPVISVLNNTCTANNPHQDFLVVDNYLEAAGVVAAMKEGISLESLKRPIEKATLWRGKA